MGGKKYQGTPTPPSQGGISKGLVGKLNSHLHPKNEKSLPHSGVNTGQAGAWISTPPLAGAGQRLPLPLTEKSPNMSVQQKM